MKITKLKKSDAIPCDLLYLADESVEAVKDYLQRGVCYIGCIDDSVVGVYVLLPTRPFTVELVNLAVREDYQRQGLAKQLIENAVSTAKKQGYKTIEVGTGNAGISQIALYQKCGFSMTWIDIDFFRRNYTEPIFENGMECAHMIRFKIDL